MSWYLRQLADPEFQLKLTIALGMVALQCLVAIWAATSSRHWFWRALAVWGAVMLMVPIRAWEPAWMFGLSSPLIVILIVLGNRWVPREPAPAETQPAPPQPSRWRFSLLDLLLLMVVVGLSIHGAQTVIRHYQPRNWLGWLASSIGLAALTAVSYACARTPRRWLDVALVCLALIEFEAAYAFGYPFTGLIAAGAALAAYGCAFDWRHWIAMLLLICTLPLAAMAVPSAGVWMRVYDPLHLAEGAWFWEQTLMMALLGGEIVSLLIIVLGLVRATRSPKLWLPWRIIVGFTLTLLLGVTLMHVGRAYLGLWRRTSPLAAVAKLDLPGNNYYRILGIATEIGLIHPAAKAWQSSLAIKPDAQTAQALKKHYQELFTLLAGQQNYVPYDPKQDAFAEYEYSSGGKWGARWSVIRELMNSLNAEADWAIENNQPGEAADVALALIRFGDMQTRGGVWIDYSFGIHSRRTGYAKLAQVRAHLSPDRLGPLIRDLQQSLAQREDPSTLRLRQADFREKSHGWGQRLSAVFDSDSYDARVDDIEQPQMFDELDITSNRLLQADLAIRQFQHDEGRLPGTLADLVPKYLPSVPLDARQHPLRFRPENGQFILYSIGPDDRDDGGEFSHLSGYYGSHPSQQTNPRLPQPPPFDLDLETLTRP
jgi:hypothetical protein